MNFFIFINIYNKSKININNNTIINLNNKERKGALFLLRKDREQYLDKNKRKKFINLIQKAYNKYDISDNAFRLYREK